MGTKPEHFFVSYNKENRGWAEWIAWQLEAAGHKVFIQAWDIRPGNNFVLKMQEATAQSQRTIPVLSSHYLVAKYTQPEWASDFAQDPTGENGVLIPVRVEDVKLEGMWVAVVYIDLVGLTEGQARKALLEGIEFGRRKPLNAPNFPGLKEFDDLVFNSIPDNFDGEEKEEEVSESSPQYPAEFAIISDPLKDWTVLSVIPLDKEQNNEVVAFSTRKENSRLVTSSATDIPKAIIDNLWKDKFTDQQSATDINLASYELLLPSSVRNTLTEASKITLTINHQSAGYSWETIFSAAADIGWISTNASNSLIRNYKLNEYMVTHTTEETSLLILSTPNLSLAGKYGILFEKYGFPSVHLELINPKNLVHIYKRVWRVWHVAGLKVGELGEPPTSSNLDDIYMLPYFIIQLYFQVSVVPELVCLHFDYQEYLKEERLDKDSYYNEVASRIAGQLLHLGAKAVVISGVPSEYEWEIFFNVFYQQMLDGNSFSKAVLKARQFLKEEQNLIEGARNTASSSYQCYGDVDFHLVPESIKSMEQANWVN